jgi:hypothetical protein
LPEYYTYQSPFDFLFSLINIHLLAALIAATIIAIYLLILHMRWHSIPEPPKKPPPPRIRVVDIEKTATPDLRETRPKEKLCSHCRQRLRINSNYCDKCGAKQ